MRINVFISLVFFVGNTLGREFSDAEYYRLPALYHLDNYERCLSQDAGVYCLGTFHLTPLHQPHPVYQLMKEYSEETYAFNHTLIHRGYCISSRCPELNDTQLTSHDRSHLTSHFERCTSRIEAEQSFRANLTSLKYCKTRADTQRFDISIAQIAFLAVVLALLVMNVIGTAYDISTKDNTKRMPILMAWSAIENWKTLTYYEGKGKSTLAAFHGIRVCVGISTCLSHSALLYYSLFLHDPRVLELVAAHPLSMFLQNSTGSEQMIVVMAGFLYAFHLLVYTETHSVSYKLVPLLLVKRIIRLSPVLLLVLSFAATWWPTLGDGPLWTATVGQESQVCRDKFWTHLLFVNNLVQADRHCILPTWYMAVDIQMFILSSFIMIFLMKYPRRMVLVLVLLFAVSCILNAALVYIFDWIPMLYVTVNPENLRTLFSDVPSFSGLYISTWGNLAACFLGLILGTMYYKMKDEEFVFGRYKWLLNLTCVVSVPLLCSWILLGYFLQHIKMKAFVVAYAALERSIYQILLLLSYVVACIISSFAIKLLSWRGWYALSRMSLSVMTVHWLVNYYLVGTTPQLLSTSITDIAIIGISTTVYTFMISVPITIFVEMPMKKLFDVVTT